jgi:hypothetical protein
MIYEARISRQATVLVSYQFEVKQEGDIAKGISEAVHEFRRQRPDESLFDCTIQAVRVS